jgi:electron transfer flavoprotein alpha subunit
MPGLLVHVDSADGAWAKGSLGLLGAARRLGAELGQPVHAAVCPDGVDDERAATLGGYGASVVHVLDAPGLGSTAQPLAAALAQVHRAEDLGYVLLSGSIVAQDAAAALAVRLDAGFVIEVVDLVVEDGALVTRRAGLGDSVVAHCGFTGAAGVAVVRAGTFAPDEPDGTAAEVRHVTPELPAWTAGVRVVGHEEGGAAGVDITEADVLVAGGRGLGTAEGFRLCEDLAGVLGGAVAATRAVVDAGWYPYTSQIGQTGKTVTPRLYIAVGISGAVQHKVGMQGSGTIVAINKDGNAPIFEYADLGVVGDLNAIVPRLTELVRARNGG